MTLLRKLFDFFVFSSLYISLCAVLMVYQTHALLLHNKPAFIVSAFVFFSTMCSYNFHWYLTPASQSFSRRIQWAQKSRSWHLALYFIGLTGTAICFFPIRQHWLALLFVSFVTFLYSAPKIPLPFFAKLKKVAIGKTLFLAFVWTFATTLLPIFIAGQTIQPVFWIFAAGRFGLIYAICILFDYRDREDDKHDGIRSMVTYFGEKGINVLFIISLCLFTAATLALAWYGYSNRTIILLLVPGLILLVLYAHAKKNFSDYLYYFVLDGLMMLSGPLMLIFGI
ncbi:MAG TPA: UbiA family prenyltransferase [Puia sp.]|nr:UbiA family prenyltransferase [Puia sp.]